MEMAGEHATPPEFQEFEKLFPEKDISEAYKEEIRDGRFNFFRDVAESYLDRLFHIFSDDQEIPIIFKIDWDKIQPFLYNLENIKEPIIQLLSGSLVHTRRMKFMLLALYFTAYNVNNIRKENGLRDTCNELGKLGSSIISLIKKVHPQVCEHHDLEPQKYEKVVMSMLSCIFACLQHAHRLSQQVKSRQSLLDCMDSFSTKSLACLVDKYEKPKVPKSWFTDPEPVGLRKEVLEEVTKLVDIDNDTKFSAVNVIGQRGMGKSTLAKSIIKHMCHPSLSSTKKQSSTRSSRSPFSCFAHLNFGNKRYSKEHMARMQENMMKQILGVDIYVGDHNNDGKRNVQWILHNISSPSILIFLDNVRECLQADSFIEDIDIKSLTPKLRVIITCQQPINRIEEYVMDKLDISHSVMLFKNSSLSNDNESESESENRQTEFEILGNDNESESENRQTKFESLDSDNESESESKNGQTEFESLRNDNENMLIESETPELFWGAERAIERLVQLCDGIPGIIVSIAHHLKSNRTANAYGDVIQSLKIADLSRFKCHYASDLSLSDIILSVYNLLPECFQLVFEEACLLFDEWDWDMLQSIFELPSPLFILKNWTMIKKSADGRLVIHNKLLKSLIVNKAQNKEKLRHLAVDVASIHKATSLNLAKSYTDFKTTEGLFLKRRIHPIMDIMPSLDAFSKSLRLLHMESGIKIKFDCIFNYLIYFNIQGNLCYDSKSPLASRMFPELRVLSISKSIIQD